MTHEGWYAFKKRNQTPFKIDIFNIYLYKQDVAFNNLQWFTFA